MNQLNKIMCGLFSLINLSLAIYLKDVLILWFLFYLIIVYILKINPGLKFIALLYGFLGIFLGFTLKLYKITTWYDTFIHFLSGIFIGLIATYVLNLLNMFDKKNMIFNLLFICLFSLAISGLWEIVEFISDNIFKSDMQRLATGVNDTMKDIIVAFLGNIIFNSLFYYEYKYNHKLLIQKFINNIIGG